MVQFTINLYSFNELDERTQQKVIEDHRRFMLDFLVPDFGDGVVDWDDDEKMEAYHEEFDYILMNDEPVIESIEVNEYLYHADGTLARTTHYIAGPLKGEIELWLHGRYYYAEDNEA